jgi:hypothetical protein
LIIFSPIAIYPILHSRLSRLACPPLRILGQETLICIANNHVSFKAAKDFLTFQFFSGFSPGPQVLGLLLVLVCSPSILLAFWLRLADLRSSAKICG